MTTLIVVTSENLGEFVKTLLQNETVVLDTETSMDDANWRKYVLGFSVYLPLIDTAYYVPLAHTADNVDISAYIEDLTRHLSSAVLIMHNAKFDLQMLEKIGIRIPHPTVEDTMLRSYVINEEPPHGLKELAVKYIGPEANVEQTIVKTLTKAFGWEKIPMPIMARYAMQDVILTWQLLQRLPSIDEEQYETLKRDYQFLRVLMDIERNGVEVDVVQARLKSSECIKRVREIESMLGYDPGKPSQLAKRLYSLPPDGLGLQPVGYGAPSKSFPGGRPKMGVAELKEHAHPEVGLVLEHRRVIKAKSVWYDGWLELVDNDNRIHPTYHQHSTVTSRLSCSNPNMQQIPRDSDETDTKRMFPVKRLLLPTRGRQLFELDYSQVELRLASVYANETSMIEVFRKNGDPHQLVADRIGVSRFVGKTINFLVLYGGGADKLQWVLKQNGNSYTSGQCTGFLSSFHEAYPGFKQCMFECALAMEKVGYIKYWSGRRRHMKYDFHKAFNSLIQGGASEIMRQSMIDLSQLPEYQKEFFIVGQVHDSLWVETADPTLIKKVKDVMEWPGAEFGLPFPVDVKEMSK